VSTQLAFRTFFHALEKRLQLLAAACSQVALGLSVLYINLLAVGIVAERRCISVVFDANQLNAIAGRAIAPAAANRDDRGQ
jgi:hypothetical protein